jgi:dolichol-phosphate mannosyltransferase
MRAKLRKVATTRSKVVDIAPWRHSNKTIRVVLPAYNEEENLGQLIERIDEAMHDSGMRYEVTVVDDGSRDHTIRIAEGYADKLPVRVQRHTKNMGLGATIRDGLKLAAEASEEGDIIVVMDADNTQTPGLIQSMARFIREGNDVVIASRYQPGAYVVGVSLPRRILSTGASLMMRTLFPIRGVKDYTCGYRAYRGTLLKEAFERYGDEFVEPDGFECMIDVLLKLREMGAIIREVPLILRYDYKGGLSKMKIARTVFRTLMLVLRRRLGAD